MRYGVAWLFILSVAVLGGCAAGSVPGSGADPLADGDHVRMVIEAADSSWLRDFSISEGEIGNRLAIDPRPLTWDRRWPGDNGEGLMDGVIANIRQEVIQSLGIRESGDVDLDCVAPYVRVGDEESIRHMYACAARGLLWVYLSPTVPRDRDRDRDGRPLWVTRVSADAGGLRYVIVDVVTGRGEGGWELIDVEMRENVID
jgi:hypothetical protein